MLITWGWGKGTKANKQLKVSTLVPLILGLVLIGGCAFSPSPPSEVPNVPDEEEQEEGEMPGGPTADRKIVKEGSITLEVKDIAETLDDVAQIAEELNGYVVSSYKREYAQGVSGHIAIRVPSQKFDEAFVRLRQLAVAVPFETTNAKDVTEEYVDLEAQLSNLLATEAQYVALLERRVPSRTC